MRKKGISILMLWVILAVLAGVCADRSAYTWSFDGAELERILLSEEDAHARERDAQRAMDERKPDTWEDGASRDILYDGAPITRKTVDEELGLNLMWGDYRVTVSYESGQEATLHTVSALRQSFIQGGMVILPEGEGKETFDFKLSDACEQVAFACDVPENVAIKSVVVQKQGVFARDELAYVLLIGGILTFLMVLSWDKRPEGAERRRNAITVLMIAGFSCMPLMWRGLYDGHDLFFHLNRVEGIASALRSGQFPVRIHGSTLLGYGYAAPQFYPEAFLYIPAILRNMGVSLTNSVRIFEMLIQLAVAGVCYRSAKGIFKESRVALASTALYTLCSYRLANLYVRGAWGESLAMIFFPLLIWGLVEVFLRDDKRWPLLACAMTGIALSHLLSTLFATLLCVAVALLAVRRWIREPKRVLACVKAAFLTAVCTACFFVPFFSYMGEGINTSVALRSADHVLQLGAFGIGFPGMEPQLPYEATDFAYTVGTVPGLAIMLGCLVMLARLYIRRDEKSELDTLGQVGLVLGGMLLLCTTSLFPWAWLCGLSKPYSTLFRQIQYPWRLVGVAVPMLAFAGAWGFLREEKTRSQGLIGVLILCAVLAGYQMQTIVQTVPVLEKEDFCDTRIEQYEYTYEGTDKGMLQPDRIVVQGTKNYSIQDRQKQGSSLSFTLKIPQGASYVEVPLLYYPGYVATANGQSCRVARGENQVVRIYGLPDGERIEVQVTYRAPMLWQISAGLSLLGGIVLMVGLRRMRKEKALW